LSDPRPTIWRQTWLRAPAVSIILVLHAAVFLLWQFADDNDALANFMVTNFLISTVHLQEGYWWTLITSAFSHFELWHVAINMFVLWSFGLALEQLWGTRKFVAFYLIAAVAGSLAHCASSSFIEGDGAIPALGASGAIAGMVLAYALHFPKRRLYFFFVIPVPAIVAVIGLVIYDLWGLIQQGRGGGSMIGHGAHLGGALAGALLWLFYFRSRFPTQAERPTQSGAPITRDEALELHRIVAKVQTEGVEALTPQERAFAEGMQEKMNRGAGAV